MTPVRSRPLYLLCAVSLLAVGCGKDGTGASALGARAEFTLEYSGSLSGRVQARGQPTVSASDFDIHSFAAAVDYADGLTVTGAQVRSTTDADVVTFVLPRKAPGEYALGFGDSGLLLFGTDPEAEVRGDPFAGRLFVATDGTIVVTEISADGVRGTVTGNAAELDPGSGTYTDETVHFQGSYDVPVVDPPGGTAVLSRAATLRARLEAARSHR